MMLQLRTLEYIQILQVFAYINWIFYFINQKKIICQNIYVYNKYIDVDSSTVATIDEKNYIKTNLIPVVVNYF